MSHEWDDDGCCVQCGFDGAEWHWWKHSTYEGKASDAKQPECTRANQAPSLPLPHDDYEDWDGDEPDRTCDACDGTGGDRMSDGIMPCEACDGEGYKWWL